MKSWAIAVSCAALSISCIDVCAAQSVLGPLLPGAGVFNSSGAEVPPAKPFGTEITQLPGKRVGSTDIKGKWLHREMKRNVEFDGVRVPQLLTSKVLDLKADGHYTLDYIANWGAVGNSPEALYASMQAHESGRFTVSGSVLLLEADSIEISRQSRGKSTKESLSNQRRAYLVRLDKADLNIAGPCADYEVEAVCQRSRSVWFSLRQPLAAKFGI
jgi:hypothetical protein